MGKNIKDLPAMFDSFGEARRAGFLAMKNLKNEGLGVVGTFCAYTPLEIPMAGGQIPVGLCSTSDETIAEAEKTLPRNLCPLIKASYGFAVADKCPYMYFADLVVGETTCDGKKKMYELLGKIKNVHILELPQSQTNPKGRELWLEEIYNFKRKIETEFQVTITDDDLRQAIKSKNKERRLLKQFYELSLQNPPPMTGLQQLIFLEGAQFKFNQEQKCAEIEQAIFDIQKTYEDGNRPVSEKAKRIVITGCPMGGVTRKVTQAIEEVGGVVVAYENCTGAKAFDREVSEDGNPYEALADFYLNIGCSVMTPDTKRFEFLERLSHEFQADGIIEMTLQACHTYAIESYAIKELAKKNGLPFLTIETDYSTGDVEQIKTRAAAFIEML